MSRKEALRSGLRTYEGRVHEFCQTSVKFTISGSCVACKSRADRQHYMAHQEKIKKTVRNYRKINQNAVAQQQSVYRTSRKSQKAQYDKEYREKNKEELVATQRQRYSENKTAIKTRQKIYYEQNRSAILAQMKVYRGTPEGRAKLLARIALRKARQVKAEGFFTAPEWQSLKKQFGNRCLCCQVLESERPLTVDHVIPLSKGGSNWITNIQPLCQPCNDRKHTKIIDYRGQDVI